MKSNQSRNKRQQGSLGEQLAKQFLSRLGYTFVTKNFSTRYGEVDLIFLDKDQVVFVEVKARRSLAFGAPYEAVTPYKLQTILKVGQMFLSTRNWHHKLARVDVVSILEQNGQTKIEHLKDVSL